MIDDASGVFGRDGGHGKVESLRLAKYWEQNGDYVSCEICFPSEFGFAANVIADTLDAKALAYGDSYKTSGEFLKLLYPKGIPTEALDDVLTMSRIFEKMKRIAENPGKPDPGGESPYKDIAGYGILGWVRNGMK